MEKEVVSTIIGGTIGLFGTVIGAIIAGLSKWHESRVITTLDIHREFQSTQLNRARTMAEKVLLDHPGKTLEEIEREVEPQKANHLWVVLNFFVRLSVLQEYGKLANNLLPRLFGYYIIKWHRNCFADRLPEHWSSKHEIDSLYRWMAKHARSEDLKRWEADAKAYREHRNSNPGRGNANAPAEPSPTT